MSHTTRRFRRLPACKGARERGMTLVELMIAMMLGLLLTAGVIQVFIGNRTTYAFNEGLSRIQENARFALDRIARTTRMAGHIGCLNDVGVFNNLNGPTAFRDDLANGLQGHEYTAVATGPGAQLDAQAVNPAPETTEANWTPALPPELADVAIRGSDVLVVRHVSGDAIPLVSPFGDLDTLTVDDPAPFLPGEVLVVTDCQRATIFQLTAVSGGDTLAHTTGGGFAPGNSVGTWSAEESYGLGSDVARLEAVAFYVGQGASGAPALFQLRLARTGATTSAFVTEELVDGIETMQVRYGVDTDNDRQIDAWQTAAVVNAANNWARVLSVEVSLVARSAEEYGAESDVAMYNVGGTLFNPVDDRRLRKAFTTTIALRNRLP